jgi:hypothetical protein
MAIPDVRIQKLPGLGRREPSADNVCGLVMGGVVTTEYPTLGVTVELNSTLDAIALGFTAAYDATNKVLVHHHIERFFKRNPSGKLFVMLVSQAITLTQMLDKTLTHGAKLLTDANGQVRVLGAALNPATGYSETLETGLNADVIAAIASGQALAISEFEAHRPVNIVIEGRHFNGTAASALDLRSKTSNQVMIVVAADYNISNTTISAAKPYEYYAAVGDVLGVISKAKVNENIGWVDKYPLTDSAEGIFTRAALSSGLDISTYASDWGTLHDKGYVFAKPHTGKSGYWFNSSPTCSAVSDDEAWLENSRTLNKAARLVRGALIGFLNSPVPLNEDGTMQAVVIGALESACEQVITGMQRDAEVSAFDVFIDPTHNFIEEGETFDVIIRIVPVGVARSITGKISLVAKL